MHIITQIILYNTKYASIISIQKYVDTNPRCKYAQE